MKAIDIIRAGLEFTDSGVVALAADMRDAAMVRPVVRNGAADGNHTLWLLGHMTFIEGSLRTVILGMANPVEHWAGLFAPGTTSVDDAAAYPSFDEVLAALREVRRGTLAMLAEIGDDGLDAVPRRVPPGFEDAMKTVGHTLLLISLHQMVHYGQIADCRRAAGRMPLF